MAETVYQQMAGRVSLLEKLSQNPDLCNLVLGLLGRCIILCAERGKPLEGIEIATPQASDTITGDLALRAIVFFHDMAITAPSIWPPQSDFAHYVRAKAYGLGLALQKNPRLNQFFQQLVERVESYAEHKGFQFGKLKVQKAIITTGDILVLQVGQNVLAN